MTSPYYKMETTHLIEIDSIDFIISTGCKRLLSELLQKNNIDYVSNDIVPDRKLLQELKNEYINICIGLKLYN